MSRALEKEKQQKKVFTQKLVIQKQMNTMLQRNVETLEKRLATATTKLQDSLEDVLATAERVKYKRELFSKGLSETCTHAVRVDEPEKTVKIIGSGNKRIQSNFMNGQKTINTIRKESIVTSEKTKQISRNLTYSRKEVKTVTRKVDTN